MNNTEKKEWISELLSNIARLGLLLLICGVPICFGISHYSNIDLIPEILAVIIICLIPTPVISLLLCIVACIFDHKNKTAIGTIVLSVVLIVLFVVFWLLSQGGMQTTTTPPTNWLDIISTSQTT